MVLLYEVHFSDVASIGCESMHLFLLLLKTKDSVAGSGYILMLILYGCVNFNAMVARCQSMKAR